MKPLAPEDEVTSEALFVHKYGYPHQRRSVRASRLDTTTK